MITAAPIKKTMNNVYISLGSNIGDREKNIKTAISELAQLGTIIDKSNIYETEPVGLKDQEDFLNMVLSLETDLSPTELIIKTQEIEHKIGRIREVANGPRKIDIDILTYGMKIIDTDNLKIPHPRMHKRKFVLLPLSEIAPKILHPILKSTVQEMLKKLKSNEKVTIWT